MRMRCAALLIAIAFVPGARSSAGTIVQLTDNDTDDANPRIDGSNVVWQRDGDVFLFDGVATVPLTSDGMLNSHPAASGSHVVWQTFDGFDWEILLYDGMTVTPLTDDPNVLPSISDSGPEIDGSDVVWVRGWANPDVLGDVHAAHWDGMTTTLIGYFVESVAVSDGNIAYTDSHDFPDMLTFDGTKISGSTFALNPDVSGSKVVWWGFSSATGSDYEIFLYDGGPPIPITNDDENDEFPRISGSIVVWQHWDGHDWEIECFDGKRIRPLTDNDTDDSFPDVSGTSVVWQGFDGHDTEIYMTTIPEPRVGALGACAIGALASLRRATRGSRRPIPASIRPVS
jgi:hypothetical protein